MRAPILLGLILLSTGCNGLRKLTDGEKAPETPSVVIGGSRLGKTPNFNVPIPANTTRYVLHGWMPANGVVAGVESAQIDVFIKDDLTYGWFKISESVIPAYYYSYNTATKSVTYHGKNLATTQEYCVYFYK